MNVIAEARKREFTTYRQKPIGPSRVRVGSNRPRKFERFTVCEEICEGGGRNEY